MRTNQGLWVNTGSGMAAWANFAKTNEKKLVVGCWGFRESHQNNRWNEWDRHPSQSGTTPTPQSAHPPPGLGE